MDTTQPTTTWEEEKYQITQAILGALEYRGFYDAGKYLDNTILEHVEPIFKALLTSREEAARKEERERVIKIAHEMVLRSDKRYTIYDLITHLENQI
jgi:DNA polymerase elongation subunit (family B)